MSTELEVKNLTIFLQNSGKELVSNVSFKIGAGESLALVGESGSGKTLTALSIVQLLPAGIRISPESTILLDGKDLLTFPEIKMQKVRGHRIGMIFQEAITALNPVLTIETQILEVLKTHFHHLSHHEKIDRAISLLEEVGMPDPENNLKAYPHELSGGLKQRAMIAIALAGEPELLIADEPTTALDVTLQAQVLQLLKKLQEKRKMSLLFITHDLSVVYQIATHVAVLYKGKLVESEPVAEFFKHPKHAYSLKLFSALPDFDAAKQPLEMPELVNEIMKVSDLKVYFPIRKGVFKRTVGYVKAVNGVSFTLKEGQTLALVGESGSGKTTTGLAMMRLIKPTSGQILFGGKDVAKLSQRELRKQRKNFQFVFQDPYSSMDPRMLVGDILAEGMLAQKIFNTREDCDKRIAQLLVYVGLEPEFANRYPHEFSGGQRQRICIARALSLDPQLLICDEPTSALDVSSQMTVLNLLTRLQKELSLSYLLITHNLAVVSYMADEVAVMYRGEIVEFGPAKQVLHHPKHSYTKKLLAALPHVPKPIIENDKV